MWGHFHSDTIVTQAKSTPHDTAVSSIPPGRDHSFPLGLGKPRFVAVVSIEHFQCPVNATYRNLINTRARASTWSPHLNISLLKNTIPLSFPVLCPQNRGCRRTGFRFV